MPPRHQYLFPPDGHGQDCYLTEGEFTAGNIVGRPLEPGTELIRGPVGITGPNPKMQMQFHANVFVGFRNGLPVDDSLRNIGGMAGRILDTFAPEFETRKAIAPAASRVWAAFGHLHPRWRR